MTVEHESNKRRPIIKVISIREAARRLRRHPDFTRGAAASLGIQLQKAGRALVMSLDDFHRLKEALEHSPEPIDESSDIYSSVH